MPNLWSASLGHSAVLVLQKVCTNMRPRQFFVVAAAIYPQTRDLTSDLWKARLQYHHPLKNGIRGGHLMEFHFPFPPPTPPHPSNPPPPSPPWLKIFEKWNGKTSGFQRSEIISGKFDHHDWPFIRAYSVVTPPTLWAKNDKGKHDLDQAGTGEFFIGATNSQTYQNIPNPAKSHHQIELLPSSLKRKGLKWIDFTNGI
jgi:hypothetical protein